VVLLLINLLLIFVGTFMETIAALLILFPILLKVALSVGVDPIHFSVIALLNLMIGLTTPPLGVCLFVAAGIGKVSIGAVSRAGFPFLVVSLIVLALVTLIPELSLFLPRFFGLGGRLRTSGPLLYHLPIHELSFFPVMRETILGLYFKFGLQRSKAGRGGAMLFFNTLLL
jgi:hypothetical protein